MNAKRTLILLAVFAVALAGPARAQEGVETIDREYGDVIRYFDDDGKAQKLERVRVDGADFETVQYTPRGAKNPLTKPGNIVWQIDYADTPNVYVDGLKNLKNEQWEQAASDFDGAKNAVDAGRARPWLLEYAAFHKGEALLALGAKDAGKLADAAEAFKDALKANPKTILFDKVQVGLIHCLVLQKKWDEARSAADALKSTGENVKHPLWQVAGAQAIADILEAQGKHTEAVTAYENVAALAQRELKFAKPEKWQSRLQAAETDAVVEKGWAMVAWAEGSGTKADWDRAKDYFSGLPGKYPQSAQVAAAVLNGLGRCMLDADPRGALLKFAEAEVVNFTARREVARALWLKSQALTKIGGDTNKKMSAAALAELKLYYPETEWARK